MHASGVEAPFEVPQTPTKRMPVALRVLLRFLKHPLNTRAGKRRWKIEKCNLDSTCCIQYISLVNATKSYRNEQEELKQINPTAGQ